VDRKGKDKQHWEDDESESNANLFNLIQDCVFVHFISPFESF